MNRLKIITYQVLTMVIQEDLNKSYPSMVAYHQTILRCLINNQQITEPFETDTY